MPEVRDPQAATSRTWNVLREEARAMVDRERFLAPILTRAVLDRASLPDALAFRLASVLASAELDVADYRALLLEGLDEDPSIAAAAALDLDAVHDRDPACRTRLHAFLNYKGFHAVQVHRMAHRLWRDGRRELAAWLSNRVSVALGPDIHPAARLGTGIMLDHGSGIVIGETAAVGNDVTILQNVTLGGTGKDLGDRHPKVRQGVMIGAGANIIGNVEIGAYSKIGAGSVVLKDVPAGCTVAGVPAQIVRLHPTEDQREDAAARDGDDGRSVGRSAEPGLALRERGA